MQDYAVTGDLRKWPNDGGPYVSFWRQATASRPSRIAFRSDRFASPSQRLSDYMHEGTHEFWNEGELAHNNVWGTEWVENNCMNN
jgi:hypothetical protein